MEQLKQLVDAFYHPTLCGSISVSGRVSVFGWSVDKDSILVALAVQGSSTGVRAVWSAVVNGKQTLYMQKDDRTYGQSKMAYARGEYESYMQPVPDSNYLSMIVVSKSAFANHPSESRYLYIPDCADEMDLNNRLYHRIKEISTDPILPQWSDYLRKEGQRAMLCDPLSEFSSMGFKFWWMLNDRERWETVVSEGLSKGRIKI